MGLHKLLEEDKIDVESTETLSIAVPEKKCHGSESVVKVCEMSELSKTPGKVLGHETAKPGTQSRKPSLLMSMPVLSLATGNKQNVNRTVKKDSMTKNIRKPSDSLK